MEQTIEQSVQALQSKIEELKKLSLETDMDLATEIDSLEKKVETIIHNYYTNLSPWQKVQLARNAERPTTLEIIEHVFANFIELHGDRLYGDDAAIIGGIAEINHQAVTIIGHQKGQNTKENIHRNFGMAHPEGYRKSLRFMKQAEKFNRPIICFINTAGAYPGIDGEKRGQSESIARNLRDMSGLKVPIISIVIGEGGSGGALALSVADKIMMLENSFYSVISPEGAAALLWKDATLAKNAADTMKITAQDLLAMKIIDAIVPEPLGGAHKNKPQQYLAIQQMIEHALKELSTFSGEELVKNRYKKFRSIGVFSE